MATPYYRTFGFEDEQNRQADQPSSMQSPSPTVAPPQQNLSAGMAGLTYMPRRPGDDRGDIPTDPGPYPGPRDGDGNGGGTGGGGGPAWPPGIPPEGPDIPDIPDPGGGDDEGQPPSEFGQPFDFNFPSPVGIPQGPQAPGQGPLTGQMQGFASNVMSNPSRFDTDLVQNISSTIDQELQRGQNQAFNRLDERMASRGMVGSNVEAETGRRLSEDFENQRMQRLNQLEKEMAQTAAQDRRAAAQIGMGANQQIFGQGMQQAQFGEGQRQFNTQTRMNQRAQQLQQQGMSADEAFRRAQLEHEAQFGQERLGMEERLRTRDQRLRQLNDLLRVLGVTGIDSDAFEDVQEDF